MLHVALVGTRNNARIPSSHGHVVDMGKDKINRKVCSNSKYLGLSTHILTNKQTTPPQFDAGANNERTRIGLKKQTGMTTGTKC